jgi:cytochrome c nitrite reductase small subunit
VSIGYAQLVYLFGTLFCVMGILLCIRTARMRFGKLYNAPSVSFWITRLPAESAAKLVAFAALVVMPAGAVFIANYHTFEGVHEVSGCASCHVMRAMANDMMDPHSGTLAARHYKNKWIAENQCYHCHSDYGFSGNLEAKMTGFRHLARYTTHTYKEPIMARVRFDNQNCLNCHQNTPKFQAVQSHHTAAARLASNQMICLNCHGQAHPSSLQRTPGSADYARLMEPMQ